MAEGNGARRWLKLTGLGVAVLVLLVVVFVLLGGGGEHGPGRHDAPSEGHTPPVGGHR